MKTTPHALAATLALSLGAALPGDARAETFNVCTGLITSVPTTLTTQGVWCMHKDLASSITSGALITVATNNVTIDCNGFKLGGLGAGPTTNATGIFAYGRSNLTVRDCHVRGFAIGVAASGDQSSGHRILDSRIEGSTNVGILLTGSAHAVRRNTILDTGGSPTNGDTSYGIYVYGDADVVDNTIDGVSPPTSGLYWGSTGISMQLSTGSVVAGNHVRNIDGGTGNARGIAADTYSLFIRDNAIANGTGAEVVAGIECTFDGTIATGNQALDFGTLLYGCDDDGGNRSE